MEKWIWFSVLVTSIMLLSYLLLRHSKYRLSLKKIAVHWVIAGVLLFLLNSSDLTSAIAVPISPLSLSTIALLGIPGLVLIQGIYFIG